MICDSNKAQLQKGLKGSHVIISGMNKSRGHVSSKQGTGLGDQCGISVSVQKWGLKTSRLKDTSPAPAL